MEDDQRMEELKRKVASGKAFGTNAYMISAAEAAERFPLVDPDLIQGAMWDPDAGLVAPRSQRVAGEMIEQAKASGRLQTFAEHAGAGYRRPQRAGARRGDRQGLYRRPPSSSSPPGSGGRYRRPWAARPCR
ncbi:MAG: FAD-dependent oxidoreductase [Arhodomonas sp.]|nr:FAD-dependent oxidoreductase [Arhodomonas sp.]